MSRSVEVKSEHVIVIIDANTHRSRALTSFAVILVIAVTSIIQEETIL